MTAEFRARMSPPVATPTRPPSGLAQSLHSKCHTDRCPSPKSPSPTAGAFCLPQPRRPPQSQTMATDQAIGASTDPISGQVKRNAGEMQAYRLREVCFRLALDCAGVTAPEWTDELRARAQAVSGLVRGWAEADERARIARGRPLPGSLRPERKRKPRARDSGYAPERLRSAECEVRSAPSAECGARSAESPPSPPSES